MTSIWQKLGDAQPKELERVLYRISGVGAVFECVYDPKRQKWDPSDTWVLRSTAMSVLEKA